MRGRRGKAEYRSGICTSDFVLMVLFSFLSIIIPVITGCAEHDRKTAQAVQGSSSSWTSVLPAVPEYSGEPYLEINNDIPFFSNSELKTDTYLEYSTLDSMGRCGQASACLSPKTLVPQGTKRGQIGHIKPTGWRTVKYDCIYEKYLYNRCHMIAWSLSGTLDDERNLITGTKYLNLSMLYGMEYETMNYIRKTENHVLYRVTPVFVNDELLCRGVLMEAQSVEDDGTGLMHCRYFFNVQPGIKLDYTDGSSEYSGVFPDKDSPAVNTDYINTRWTGSNSIRDGTNPESDVITEEKNVDFIINTNTGKFHLPTCPNAKKTKPQNRQYYTGSGDDLIARGYTPAGCCDP